MARKRTGRPPGRPPGTPAFARVSRAREALAKEAEFYVRNHKTAATVAAKRGKATDYTKGMREYARATKARNLASDLTPSLPTVVKAAGGGWILNQLAQAIAGR